MPKLSREYRRRVVAIVVLALIPLSGAAARFFQRDVPVMTTGSDVPDATLAGNPDAAMEHCRKLLAKYKAAGWQHIKLPWEDWLLPDRQYAEQPDFRSSRQSSFVIPQPNRTPEWAELAFFTNIYVRGNVSRYADGQTKSRPGGFFIVAFRDGRVEKVPIEDVRMIPSGDAERMMFPGMKGYDPDGPKHHWVQNAAPPDSPIARAASKLVPKTKQAAVDKGCSKPPAAAK